MPPDQTVIGPALVSALPDATLRSQPVVLTGLLRGTRRTCPACGKGKLFCGYLAVRPVCAVCGNDNEQYPSDDFAPYVTISLVLHLMVPALFLADRTWVMSSLFEGALASHPDFLGRNAGLAAVCEGSRDRLFMGRWRDTKPGRGSLGRSGEQALINHGQNPAGTI